MEVLKIHWYAGPNRWAAARTAEVRVRWTTARGEPQEAMARTQEAWRKIVPLARSGIESAFRVLPAGRRRALEHLERFAERLGGNPSPAIVLGDALRMLQAACGVDASFVQVQETDEPGVDLVVIEYEEQALLEGCLAAAQAWSAAAARGETIDAGAELRKLADLADDARLGPSGLAIVRAAAARGISSRRLRVGSLVQYGEGARQRRTWTAETDATSAIAESIAQDKQLTKRLLRAAGVPVPLGRAVTSAADAWAAASEIGVPVVVKPRKANHARGVSVNVTTREEIEKAYDWAVKDGDDTGVIVEQYARGQQHRLLVVGDRLAAAARGESEYVIGDGRQTIEQLVDAVNRDPRRGENYTDPLTLLRLDAAALIELARQGYQADSVPAAGTRVLVQQVGDLTTDCTRDVHPENAAQAVLAARVVGLDVAGMDVVAEDISRPLVEQRGAILEVNAGPSLGMHVAPLHGTPQPVGEAIIELLFPGEANGRIPIVVVMGSSEGEETARGIVELWQQAGWRVGVANATGVWCGRQRVSEAGGRVREQVEALIGHPQVDAIVFELPLDQACEDGLGCDRVDVAVLLPGATCPTERELGGLRAVAHALGPQGFCFAPEDTPIQMLEALHARQSRDAITLVRRTAEPARASDAATNREVRRSSGQWTYRDPRGFTELPPELAAWLGDAARRERLFAALAVWVTRFGVSPQ